MGGKLDVWYSSQIPGGGGKIGDGCVCMRVCTFHTTHLFYSSLYPPPFQPHVPQESQSVVRQAVE